MRLKTLALAMRKEFPQMTTMQSYEAAVTAMLTAASQGRSTGEPVTKAMIDDIRSGKVTGTWKERRTEYRLARRLYWYGFLDRSMYGQDACELCDDSTGFICPDHTTGRSTFAAERVSTDVRHASTETTVFSYTQTVCGRLEKTGSASLVAADEATCKNCRYRIEQFELTSGVKITNVKTCEVTK